jgi:pimeloyl-ACP methyl ester carboxylesterase
MRFYSGFSLQNEAAFFKEYLKKSEYNVAGFSYGAIKALHYVLTCKERIDTLQLFSPAFFHAKSDKFKRLQMAAYLKDEKRYLDIFLTNCFLPYGRIKIEQAKTDIKELEELLFYRWNEEELLGLKNRGIAIEVYLGEQDKIIDAQAAKEFFLPFATTYMIMRANHFLQTRGER